jgi:DNA-binding GntR family transcriptional regulator
MYNISRTTVRHILCHLCERGVLSQVNHDYQILRQPEVQDGFDGSSASLAEQNRLFEQAFFTMINQRQLRAGSGSPNCNWRVPRASARSWSENFY